MPQGNHRIDARRTARVGPDGELIPMAEQDRSQWDQRAIAEGIALVSDALPRRRWNWPDPLDARVRGQPRPRARDLYGLRQIHASR